MPDAIPIRDLIVAVAVIVLGGVGTFLLLPHRHGRVRARSAHLIGGVLAVLAVALFALFWRPPGVVVNGLFFYAFSAAAILSAILMVTNRDPVHSALWFAAVVLSTSGLFLLAGAQFLAAGTIIVYAGAIIVTFLFVIMLAQQQGRALYDRAARAPLRSTLTCFLLFWGLIYSLLGVRAEQAATPERQALVQPFVKTASHPQESATLRVLKRAQSRTVQLPESPAAVDPRTTPPHVAGLGGTLFTDHLLSVEIAGVLLFAALVGALAIATPKAPIRPGQRPTGTQTGASL